MPRAERSMVPDATPTSYYGRPVIKEPTWRWMIPAYLFSGGVAATTAMVAAGARALGDEDLAVRANLTSLAAVGASTYFLIDDLGRPARFHHMLRVAKPTSPMSVGTWIFSAFSSLDGLAAAARVATVTGLGPAAVTRLAPMVAGPAGAGAAAVAPALATYTGVLVADSAVPAWHESRRHLPWLFAASATAAGGGVSAVLAVARRNPGPAFRSITALAVAGAVAELALDGAMHRHLRGITTGDPDAPDLGFPYREGTAHRLGRAARMATAAGVAALALGRRSRLVTAAGGLSLATGSALERFAVFHAGVASARHPAYTVGPQRQGLARKFGADG